MVAAWKGLKHGGSSSIVGNPNYGSARGSAPLAPLYVGWLPYSIHFGNTALHCRSLQWTISQTALQRHSKLLTGDMSVGMPWLFMAWGSGGVLNACARWGSCPAHFLDNAANLTHISGQFGTIQTRLTSKF